MNSPQDHRKELLRLKADLIEKQEAEPAEHRRRMTWITEVLEAWDDTKYPTLADFMAGPEGQRFLINHKPGKAEATK